MFLDLSVTVALSLLAGAQPAPLDPSPVFYCSAEPALHRCLQVWASYDEASGIVQLRPATNLDRLQCFYLRLGGQNAPSQSTSDKLTMVILGGAAISSPDGWRYQCDPASYNSVSNLLTAPQCLTSGGSKSPMNSTIVYSMTFSSSSGESLLWATRMMATHQRGAHTLHVIRHTSAEPHVAFDPFSTLPQPTPAVEGSGAAATGVAAGVAAVLAGAAAMLF